MAEYEVVREIKNMCPNNQMRDVFFEEVETDNPEEYVRNFLKGKVVEVHSETAANGCITVFADCEGLVQQFLFTPM